jgi:hypothetical protein
LRRIIEGVSHRPARTVDTLLSHARLGNGRIFIGFDMSGIATFWQRQSAAVRIGARLFAALFVVLWPWPALGRIFAVWASALANAVFRLSSSDPPPLHLRPEGPSDSWNAILAVTDASGLYQELAWDLRRVPYLPMAVFAALVVAIPFGRASRRLLVLGVGLMALHLVPMLRLLVLVGAEAPVRLVEMPSAVHSALIVACGVLVFPPSMAYVVPLALYLICMWHADREALKSGVWELLGKQRPHELSIETEAKPAKLYGVVVRAAKGKADRRRKRPRGRNR